MKQLETTRGEETKAGELGEEENKEENDEEYKMYKNFWSIQKYLNNPC